MSPSRRSFLLGGLATAAVAALPACGSSSDDSSSGGDAAGSGQESWTFTDDRGEKITLPARPSRIAGLSDEVAALWGFGVAPAALFNAFLPSADDPQFEGFDLTQVVEVGNVYGEIDVEKLAAERPDLIVSHVYPESRGGEVAGVLPFGFKDADQLAQIEKIAPVLCVAMKGSAADVVARNAELAEALGADLDSGQNAEDRKDFEDASEELRTAASDGRSILAIAGYETEGVYVAQAPDDPALTYYTSLGVQYPDVDDAEYYWDQLSWENVGTYQSDVILYSQRGALTGEQMLEQPTFAQLPAARAGQLHPWRFEPMSWGKQAAWMRDLAGYLRDARSVT